MKLATRIAAVMVGLSVSVVLAGRALAEQAPTDATPVLTKAREALGGEKKLASIKTIVASGQTRQIRGENLIPIVFEINIELPAKYSRRDETPAVESGYTTTGFSSDDLIQLPPPTMPTMPPMVARPGGPPPPTPEQIAAQQAAQRKNRVATLKQDYARLMLGFFAASTDVFPLTFQKFGIAESPQGKADVITVLGPNNFTANLLISQQTNLPVMLSWVPAAPPARGGAAAPSAPPEQRLYFADYRDAGGVMWPHRIRRAAGPDTTEETTFDRFRLNARIDPKKFEVVK
jgi:hypothetical protein